MKHGTDRNSRDTEFVKSVLTYYKAHGRTKLLWRKHINAYRILVSEIMLQQTQVARVTLKFDMWCKKYPTLHALGKATFKDILILWQGLGYQRRAKALFDISQNYKKIPYMFEELCEMPGVGTYTASAICAFAYDSFSHPVLETNIRTALIEHYYRNTKKIDDTTLYDLLLRLEKNNVVQKTGARNWYYALMDYGAYLKKSNISHNTKSSAYTKQKPYKGSVRELRAKILFAVTHKKTIPVDNRSKGILNKLIKEGYLIRKGFSYKIKE